MLGMRPEKSLLATSDLKVSGKGARHSQTLGGIKAKDVVMGLIPRLLGCAGCMCKCPAAVLACQGLSLCSPSS